MDNKKFLDYEGFKIYHDELVKNLKNLKYDPQRMFASKSELTTLSKWTDNKYGIIGLKDGLIVTVGDQIWQLVDASRFESLMRTIGIDRSSLSAEVLGWKIVGSTTEFEIEGHTLKLLNNK